MVQNPKGGGLDSSFGGSINQLGGVAKSTETVEKYTWSLAGAIGALALVSAFLIGSTNTGAPLEDTVIDGNGGAQPVQTGPAPNTAPPTAPGN